MGAGQGTRRRARVTRGAKTGRATREPVPRFDCRLKRQLDAAGLRNGRTQAGWLAVGAGAAAIRFASSGSDAPLFLRPFPRPTWNAFTSFQCDAASRCPDSLRFHRMRLLAPLCRQTDETDSIAIGNSAGHRWALMKFLDLASLDSGAGGSVLDSFVASFLLRNLGRQTTHPHFYPACVCP